MLGRVLDPAAGAQGGLASVPGSGSTTEVLERRGPSTYLELRHLSLQLRHPRALRVAAQRGVGGEAGGVGSRGGRHGEAGRPSHTHCRWRRCRNAGRRRRLPAAQPGTHRGSSMTFPSSSSMRISLRAPTTLRLRPAVQAGAFSAGGSDGVHASGTCLGRPTGEPAGPCGWVPWGAPAGLPSTNQRGPPPQPSNPPSGLACSAELEKKKKRNAHPR